MQISIRTLEGREIKLEVQPSDKILAVKTKLQSQERIRADLQRLMFDNKPLENGRTLSSYGIGDEAIIYLVLRKFFR